MVVLVSSAALRLGTAASEQPQQRGATRPTVSLHSVRTNCVHRLLAVLYAARKQIVSATGHLCTPHIPPAVIRPGERRSPAFPRFHARIHTEPLCFLHPSPTSLSLLISVHAPALPIARLLRRTLCYSLPSPTPYPFPSFVTNLTPSSQPTRLLHLPSPHPPPPTPHHHHHVDVRHPQVRPPPPWTPQSPAPSPPG